jgi:hypothetical protein
MISNHTTHLRIGPSSTREYSHDQAKRLDFFTASDLPVTHGEKLRPDRKFSAGGKRYAEGEIITASKIEPKALLIGTPPTRVPMAASPWRYGYAVEADSPCPKQEFDHVVIALPDQSETPKALIKSFDQWAVLSRVKPLVFCQRHQITAPTVTLPESSEQQPTPRVNTKPEKSTPADHFEPPEV